ncbi:hypothetical protein ACET3Z_030565 [Daucus carota]
MDSKPLAALLSSLIPQILLILLHILPLQNPNSIPSNLYPILSHFLSSGDIAAATAVFSRKRKRAQLLESRELQDEPRPTNRVDRVDSADSPESPIPRSPDSFKQVFKMKASTFEWLATLLEPLLECRDPVDSPIDLSTELRLGIGLFRLSTGSDYPEISTRFGVSEPVSRFCVKQLCRVLCTNFRFWVGFPNPNELEEVTNSFETLTGIPNCCGVLSTTRFKNLRNEGIAAQIVVDSSSRILSIVAGLNGQKGNFPILKSSTLYKDIQDKKLLNALPIDVNSVSVPQYFVGDGSYPLLSWLVVPFIDPMPGSCEENFNKAYDLMRVSSLKTIASLRSWGVLSRPVEEEIKTVVAYIGACSILHNVLLMREDNSALCDDLTDNSVHDQRAEPSSDVMLESNVIDNKGFEIRSALATRLSERVTSDHTLCS